MSYSRRNKALIAADLGNSRLKLLIAGAEATKAKDRYCSLSYTDDGNWAESIAGIISRPDVGAALFCYSSVNKPMLDELLKHISPLKDIITADAGEYIGRQTAIDFSRVEGMGTDRKLSLFGALASTKPPFITIDCGTAITVNVVDGRSRCLGGTIMPGLYTQAASLYNAAHGLPEVSLSLPGAPLGANTDDAVRSGIITGVFGALKEIIGGIAARYFAGAELPVVATGGTVGLLAPMLQEGLRNITINARLNLEGIIYLVEKT